MRLETLIAFALLELTLCLIPGPAVLLTISCALRRGVRHGLAAATGILAGNTLYFVLSGLGVAALLLASFHVFTAVKWAGAAYLAYLGARALFARRGVVPEPVTAQSGERRRAVAAGFLTQVSNPKAIVFFVAILPQFIDPRAPLFVQLGLLTLVSVGIEALVLSVYAFGAGALRRTAAVERASLWIERAGGAVLIAIAARIAREPLATP